MKHIRKVILFIDLLLSFLLLMIGTPILFCLWIYRKLFFLNNNYDITAYIISSAYTISDMKKKTNSIEHLMTVLNPNNTFDKVIFNFFPGSENINMKYKHHFFFERKQLFKKSLFQLNGIYFVYSIFISLFYCLKYRVNFIYAYDPHGGGLLAVFISQILNLKSGMSQGTDYWETKIVPEFVSNENFRKVIERFVYSKLNILEIPHSYIETIRKIYGNELAKKCIPYHFPINLKYIEESKQIKSTKVDDVLEKIGNKKIVLTVSRISPEKHYNEYIKLAKRFKDYKNVVFLYVGDGPENDKFIEATNDLYNFVWIPSLQNSEVIYLYSKIDIFIGIYVGMALREAMAVGCAIVVYSWDVLKYDLGDAGIQIEPFDLSSLTENVKLLLDHQNLKNDLKIKSKQRAESILSTIVIAINRRNRYKKLLGMINETETENKKKHNKYFY